MSGWSFHDAMSRGDSEAVMRAIHKAVAAQNNENILSRPPPLPRIDMRSIYQVLASMKPLGVTPRSDPKLGAELQYPLFGSLSGGLRRRP